MKIEKLLNSSFLKSILVVPFVLLLSACAFLQVSEDQVNSFLKKYDQLISKYETVANHPENIPDDAVQKLTNGIFSLAEEFKNLPEMKDWKKEDLDRYMEITGRYGRVVGRLNDERR